jgi:hypothetical protein
MGLIQAGLNLLDASSNKVGLRPSLGQIAGQGIAGYGQGVNGYINNAATNSDNSIKLQQNKVLSDMYKQFDTPTGNSAGGTDYRKMANAYALAGKADIAKYYSGLADQAEGKFAGDTFNAQLGNKMKAMGYSDQQIAQYFASTVMADPVNGGINIINKAAPLGQPGGASLPYGNQAPAAPSPTVGSLGLPAPQGLATQPGDNYLENGPMTPSQVNGVLGNLQSFYQQPAPQGNPAITALTPGVTPREKAKETALGQADAAQQAAMPSKAASTATFIDSKANLDKTIDEASKMVTGWSAGYGAMLSGLPESDARNLSNKLDTIKANVGFDTLQEMRANSPTGGALGAVSDMENKLLQAKVQSLDQYQGTGQLKANLKDIKDSYAKSFERLRKAYEQDKAAGLDVSRVSQFFEGNGAEPPPQSSDSSDPLGIR